MTDFQKTYRLVLGDDSRGTLQIIEFEADGPQSVLLAVDRYCNGREARIYDAGTCLGRVRKLRAGGFWVVSPGD